MALFCVHVSMNADIEQSEYRKLHTGGPAFFSALEIYRNIDTVVQRQQQRRLSTRSHGDPFMSSHIYVHMFSHMCEHVGHIWGRQLIRGLQRDVVYIC
jgi:hypothetical protein